MLPIPCTSNDVHTTLDEGKLVGSECCQVREEYDVPRHLTIVGGLAMGTAMVHQECEEKADTMTHV